MTGRDLLSNCRAVKAIAIAALMFAAPEIAIAQTPTGITLVSSTVCGRNPGARVNLSGPAPAGGLAIQLSSSIPSAGQVPASVTAAAGATSAQFTVSCVQIAQPVAVTISATANGTTQTALINVAPPVLQGLSVAAHDGGESLTVQATLSGAAPPGGQTVTLLRNGPVRVPQLITVPAGATSVTFSVGAAIVSAPTTATITGTSGVSRNVEFVVLPPAPKGIKFQGNSSFLNTVTASAGPQKVRVELAMQAPEGGLSVKLTSANTNAVTVPPEVVVREAQTTADFFAEVHPVAQRTNVSITARVGTFSKTGSLTVAPVAVGNLALDPASVVGGMQSAGRVTLTAPAPSGGITVQLSSTNTSLARVSASLTVPAGSTSATFNVLTLTTAETKTALISATAGGETRSVSLTVGPAATRR